MELLAASQEAGHQEAHLGPKFAEVVLEGGAGEGHAVGGVELADKLGNFCGRVLDVLCFVEHEEVELVLAEFFKVSGEEGV